MRYENMEDSGSVWNQKRGRPKPTCTCPLELIVFGHLTFRTNKAFANVIHLRNKEWRVSIIGQAHQVI